MTRKDEIKLSIFEAYENHLITEDEKEDLFLALEMKTREEYSIDKFKSRYHYNDSKEEIEEFGHPTITIDGVKYTVDLSGKPGEVPVYTTISVDEDGSSSKFSKHAYNSKSVCSVTKTKDGHIVLSPNFFKLKNLKRRSAVLQHEVGHVKMHSDFRYKRVKPETANEEIRNLNASDDVKRDLANPNIYPIGKRYKTEEDRRVAAEKMAKQRNGSDKQLEEKRAKADKDLLDSHDRGIEAAKKYKSKDGTHMGLKEYEADRYAANKTSSSDVRKSMREMSKLEKKSGHMSKEESLNNEEANKERSKALKDKTLQREKYYKEV